MNDRSKAAKKAWATRQSATYRARKTAVESQRALERWAREHAWKVVFMDSESGNPRTGIVDAVLVRVRPKEPDMLDIKLVQIKAGSAGLKAREMKRLCNSVSNLSAEHLVVLFDGEDLMFSPSEPI